MPTKVVKRGNKFRIVEVNTGRIAKNKGGTAMDGGGRTTRAPVLSQNAAVNIKQARKRGTKIPRK